jgi:hypothetical protein
MYVYLQFITDSTDRIRHIKGSEIYSQWHLQQNNAMQCALAWGVPGVWP